jgi:hypothetical protein
MTDEQHCILIRIFSNHGHASLVGLAEIDVMSVTKTALPIAKIEIVGEYKHNSALPYLVDRDFIKKDDDRIWKHQWPPESPATTVDILLTIEDSGSLETLRIWPDSLDITRSAKGIQVYVDDRKVYSGELEPNFGSVISLRESGGEELLPEVKALLETKRARQDERILDEDGQTFPLLEFQVLEFQVLDKYAAPQAFGLSMIRMYDVVGQLIAIDPDRSSFEIKNCGPCSELDRLFMRRQTKFGEGFVPWRGTTLEGTPRIIAKFEDPVKALAIEIVNADIAHTDEDIAVGKMQVLADNRSLWVGKLKHRTSLSMDRKPNSTFVFTICTVEVKRRVLGNQDARD